jgi:protein tyrosine/serine phosphatase
MSGRKISRKIKLVLAILAVLIAAAGTHLAVNALKKGNPLLNLAVVEEGVLIRSAKPYIGDIDDLEEDYGIRSIICLNREEEPEIEDYARSSNIKIICMDMRAAQHPSPRQVELFFNIIEGKKIKLDNFQDTITRCTGCDEKQVRFEKPILVHCLGGSDRTGIMIALYRIRFQQWTKARAKWDMILHFHNPIKYPALFRFLDEYEPGAKLKVPIESRDTSLTTPDIINKIMIWPMKA